MLDIHVFFSAAMLALSIAAIVSAYHAMKRGLTYSALVAVVVVLAFLGIANLLHILGETVASLSWLEEYNAEHIVSIIGFAAFVLLEMKSRRVELPKT